MSDPHYFALDIQARTAWSEVVLAVRIPGGEVVALQPDEARDLYYGDSLDGWTPVEPGGNA